ncbi:MAG TPA: c-type cytochrome domain-containing protein [Planctomycetota bacterium]
MILAPLLLLFAPALPQEPGEVFETQVLPILRTRCFSCHASPDNGGPAKPKGRLRLDTRERILAGVRDDPVLVAGKPDESILFELVSLPREDLDRMPPEGDPLEAGQVAVIRAWIAGGADFGAWTAATGPVAESGPAIGAPLPTPASVALFQQFGQGLAPLSAAVLAKAAGDTARIEPVQPGSPLLRVEFYSRESAVGDRELAALTPLRQHLAVLDLGGTKVGDAGLARLAGMTRLVRLDLHGTAVGDKGLAALAGLAELRSLNLYGTNVGDAGLDALAKLGKLESVYLWGTRVTAAGAARLQQKLPGARVVQLMLLPAPPVVRPADDNPFGG